MKVFDSFKRGSFAIAWGPQHPLNSAQLSDLIPVIYIHELEAINLALDTSKTHSLYPLLIIADNQAAITTAELILQGKDDFLEMANQRPQVANLLAQIAKNKDRQKREGLFTSIYMLISQLRIPNSYFFPFPFPLIKSIEPTFGLLNSARFII